MTDTPAIDFDDLRARLTSEQLKTVDGAFWDIVTLKLGTKALPLGPALMAGVRTAYLHVVGWGHDARPLELATFALKVVGPNLPLTADDVALLSRLAFDRSVPNAADGAAEVLRARGIEPVKPAEPARPKRAPKPKLAEQLAALRPGLRSDDLETLRGVYLPFRKATAADAGALREAFEDLQHAILFCASQTPQGDHHPSTYLEAFLRAARFALPHPKADEALFRTLATGPRSIVRNAAVACVKAMAGPGAS